MKVILAVAVLAAVCCSVYADVVVLAARLNGNNNVGSSGAISPTGSTATGIFVGFYDTSQNIINYFVVHNVVNTTLAHIHGPANTTQNAAVLFDTGAPGTGTTYLSGQWTDTNATQRANLFGGNTYFNVHSQLFPSGEIRGQIYQANSTYTHIALLDWASVANFTGSPSSANGLGLFSLSVGQNFSVVVDHLVSSANAAHIHGPAAFCVSAGVLFPFSSPTSEITQTFQYASSQVTDLNNQLHYVNVHSPNYPNGEIRGQILPLTYYNGSPGVNTFRAANCVNPTPTPTPVSSTTSSPATTLSPTPTATVPFAAASVAVTSFAVIALAAVALL